MKPEDYVKFRKDLKKTIDDYFNKEEERERMLHNVIMFVCSIAMDESNNISLPEIIGSIDTAKFELLSMMMLPLVALEEDDLSDDENPKGD